MTLLSEAREIKVNKVKRLHMYKKWVGRKTMYYNNNIIYTYNIYKYRDPNF